MVERSNIFSSNHNKLQGRQGCEQINQQFLSFNKIRKLQKKIRILNKKIIKYIIKKSILSSFQSLRTVHQKDKKNRYELYIRTKKKHTINTATKILIIILKQIIIRKFQE